MGIWSFTFGSQAQEDSKCSTPGESVPAGDGCNTCTCEEDGTLGKCTIELCINDSNTTSEGKFGVS